MKRITKNMLLGIVALFTIVTAYGQTSNDKLNSQLNEMRESFLAEDYETLSSYTYPRVIEMIGGKEKMIQATRNSINQMKREGFYVIGIKYKDASDFFKLGKELQCSLTQEITMQIP